MILLFIQKQIPWFLVRLVTTGFRVATSATLQITLIYLMGCQGMVILFEGFFSLTACLVQKLKALEQASWSLGPNLPYYEAMC